MAEPKNKNQKRIQETYRKQMREKSSNSNWAWFLVFCVIPVLILLVTSALFDLGVQLPEFFGR
ncbi:hypothetical protein [Rossellomorea vietnamensis]|uniref:Uncharacterized protein n=1 Tax=Rossellomorea vietnamensis TaxID=218284 RepID=A0A0P6VZQ7_9BACI|nr:hypothetical protein [Rossellomorea vietnamensis]KPL58472.1 hypothetical protein AM506_16590 [Rossellomorea vietnamensis]